MTLIWPFKITKFCDVLRVFANFASFANLASFASFAMFCKVLHVWQVLRVFCKFASSVSFASFAFFVFRRSRDRRPTVKQHFLDVSSNKRKIFEKKSLNGHATVVGGHATVGRLLNTRTRTYNVSEYHRNSSMQYHNSFSFKTHPNVRFPLIHITQALVIQKWQQW